MEVYFSVKNFGKIKEARVNISNFTIFVGNNNSGKTQLMELIYAVIKCVSRLRPDIDIPRIDSLDAFSVGEKELYHLNDWVNNYLAGHIREIIDKTFNAAIPIEEATIEFEHVDRSYVIYFLKDKTIEYLLKEQLCTQESLTEMILDDKNAYRALVVKKNAQGKEEERAAAIRFSDIIPIYTARMIEIGYILGDILGGQLPEVSNILFLPASRTGLMLLYKHYFGYAGQNLEEGLYAKKQMPKGITQPVLDFLSFLLQYNYTERTAQDNKELLHFIFSNLIDGTISERGEATVYIPKGQKNEIPVFVASSMVNEVVPVTKALTDSEQVDFIFYDEVETSMHPLKQIEMVKLLNRLNNKGIKLLVSTHSDTMATKINNLLLLSRGNYDFEVIKTALEKNGIQIEKEDLLDTENIHVYQFINESQGKSIVQELEFKEMPGTGYDFSLFNDSMISLFEEAKIAMGIEDED